MVTITLSAAEKLRTIIADEGKSLQQVALRVFVQGGGCSGFQYGLSLDEGGKGPADQEFESNGIKVLVDPISIRYLDGAEVDFVETPNGGGLTIKNPNATSTCGCGQSFNTDFDDGMEHFST